jgi:hypothetical protein
MYASAQTLDFLAMAKNAFFPNWKLLVSHPGFPDGYELRAVDEPKMPFEIRWWPG